MTKTLWTTSVGSHMWGMQHPGSDVDLFTAYAAPTSDLLRGIEHRDASHFKSDKSNNVDKSSHEIGMVVNQLIKMNTNFLWGTMSPILIEMPVNEVLVPLRMIVTENLSKQLYYPIHGMAIHNWRKYIEPGKDHGERLTKTCNTIVRTINFGIGLLLFKKFEFRPVKDMTAEDVVKSIDTLKRALEFSSLPEHSNPEPFRNLLMNIRIRQLEGRL